MSFKSLISFLSFAVLQEIWEKILNDLFWDRDLKFGDNVNFLILNQSYFGDHARVLIRQPVFVEFR